jgi:hypothetical protein
MKTKSILISACMMLSMALLMSSYGQSSGGIGVFAPGIHTIRFSEMNSFLPAGYPEITNMPFVTAGGGYGIFSNIVFGGEGGTIHAGSFTKGVQQVDLSGEFGFFSLGYVVMNNRGLLVYPLVSAGENDLTMYIHQKDQTSTFNAITGEPFQAATLRYNTRMLKFSVAGLYALKGERSEKGTSGLLIGFQAGYQMAYKTGFWKYDNGLVAEGPDFSNNGFFLQLLIGGGGVMRK